MSSLRITRPLPAIIVTAILIASAGSAVAVTSSTAQPARPAVASGSTASVTPLPGSKYAESTSEISFRGVSPSSIKGITVTGSSSGVHTGRISAHSDGKGASFVPYNTFTQGETVTVTTPLHVFGADNGDWTFTVGRGARGSSVPLPVFKVKAGTQSFHSEPNLHPVVTQTVTGTASPTAGLNFISPYGLPGVAGNEITDASGQVVYYAPARTAITDFRVQTFHGRPVLTWWEGKIVVPGYGVGKYVIADTSYKVIKTFTPGNRISGDGHEFVITPQNTALISSYAPTLVDASAEGGQKSQVVLDTIAQELDLDTGRTLFEWHALDHISLADSYIPATGGTVPWDAYHLNSIETFGGNRLLLSMRSTHAVYAISRATGAISLTIGGKHSSVKTTTFTHSQHDAEPHADGTITIFDNGVGAGDKPHKDSRGLVIKIVGNTVKVVKQLPAPNGELAFSQGNLQTLQNGYLVNYGSTGTMTEFDSSGAVVLNTHFQRLIQTYRAYKGIWHATPTTSPKLATAVANGASTTWVSWNGATEVASWRVLTGPSPSALAPATTVAKSGFETAISVAATSGYEAVQALDSSGKVIGTTATAAIS